MSSSSRKKREDPDNFPTPQWTVRRLFETIDFGSFGSKWLEPSAGDGALIEVVDEFIPGINWTAVELRDTRADLQSLGLSNSQINIQDFFQFFSTQLANSLSYDVAILNPPFKFGIEFVRLCRELADWVIVFQTLNFLGSSKRNDWLRADFPDLYVIPDRVAHMGSHRSDSVYSAWFVWSPEKKQEGRTVLLDCTSKEERRACFSRLRRATDEKATLLRSMVEAM